MGQVQPRQYCDHQGRAVAGSSCVLNNLFERGNNGGNTVQKGLDLVECLGCSKVIVVSDSLEVIEACTGVVEIWTPYTAILVDIFQKAFRIGLVCFSHCPRNANKAAHNLAKLTYESKVAMYWDDDPPTILLPDFINDVTVM